jgi:hypothetical protein
VADEEAALVAGGAPTAGLGPGATGDGRPAEEDTGVKRCWAAAAQDCANVFRDVSAMFGVAGLLQRRPLMPKARLFMPGE